MIACPAVAPRLPAGGGRAPHDRGERDGERVVTRAIHGAVSRERRAAPRLFRPPLLPGPSTTREQAGASIRAVGCRFCATLRRAPHVRGSSSSNLRNAFGCPSAAACHKRSRLAWAGSGARCRVTSGTAGRKASETTGRNTHGHRIVRPVPQTRCHTVATGGAAITRLRRCCCKSCSSRGCKRSHSCCLGRCVADELPSLEVAGLLAGVRRDDAFAARVTVLVACLRT